MTIDSLKMEQDYTIEPLTGTDVLLKDFILDIRFIVTGLLDSEKLFEGLNKLIVEKWPYVGARVASLPQGRFELRIPNKFNESTPSALFEAYEAPDHIDIADCFNRLPDLENVKEESDLMVFGHLMRFKPDAFKKMKKINPSSILTQQCSASNYGPIRTTVKDHIDSGLPLVTVVVYRFPKTGETVVRTLLPHCVFDASNMASLYRAWSDTLNGKIDNVPTILSFAQAPQSIKLIQDLTSLKKEIKQRPKLPSGGRYADPLPVLVFFTFLLLRWIFIPLLRFRKPSFQERVTLFIPQKMIEDWRKEAAEYAEQNGKPKETFLSDSDLYTCWAMQKMAKHTNLLDGWFTLIIAYNLRTQSVDLAQKLGVDLRSGTSLSHALKKAKSVFLHNGVIGMDVGTYLWRDVNKWPKWSIAFKIRETIIKTRKPENAFMMSDCMASYNQSHLRPDISQVIPMDPKSVLVTSTSWKQSDLFASIDFSIIITKSSSKPNPENVWASSVLPGHISDLAGVNEVHNKPPIFSVLSILGVRPGKGMFVSVLCDPYLIRKGEFGHYIDLDHV